MSRMDVIEQRAKDFAVARRVLAERVEALQAEIDDAKRRKVPGIKAALGQVAEAQARLKAEIDAGRDLFNKPRTQVFHGIKVGLQKGKGSVSFADEERVITLIRKHMAERFDELVKVTEKVRKGPLNELSVKELERLGCESEGAGDVVLIKDTASEVDKLVNALLKGIEDEGEDA